MSIKDISAVPKNRVSDLAIFAPLGWNVLQDTLESDKQDIQIPRQVLSFLTLQDSSEGEGRLLQDATNPVFQESDIFNNLIS